MWGNPSTSILLRGNAEAMILNNTAHKGFEPIMIDGYLQIVRLNRLHRPDLSYNVFETAPRDWFIDKSLINKAISGWEILDDKNRHLLNAILFDDEFFQRFCLSPSSVNHHHSYQNGNLEHTLEVISFITDNIHRFPTANLQLALIYGWLHDIGKADEYQSCSTPDKQYKLTPNAYLHGHKLNGLYLIIRALAKYVPLYPEKTFDHLRHLLEPHPNNITTDLRKSQMIEHLIVSQADSASSASNLYSASYQAGLSFGKDLQKSKILFRYE
jgi:3'-5' exoribonuclease